MKKILYTVALLLSFNSSAVVLEAVGSDAHVVLFPPGCAAPVGGIFLSLDCMTTLTTSLPSILVQDEEINLASSEAVNLLYAEIGEEETPLANAVAKILNVSPSQIFETMISLDESNQEVSIEAIVIELSKK